MFDEKIEDEYTLPRATVDKLIHTILNKKAIISKDGKEIIRTFAKKFLLIIAGEANKKCENDKKKTILTDHVLWALEKYNLNHYINTINTTIENYIEYTKYKPSKQNKFKESGLTMEQLHKEQLKLFEQAKIKTNNNITNLDDINIKLDIDIDEINSQKTDNNK